MHSIKVLPVIISAVVGVIYFLLLTIIWAYIPNFNPITLWLIENLGATSWYRPLVFTHDFLLNIILGFPLATLIYSLRPKNYLLYSVAALLPNFIWSHSVWINDPSFNDFWLPIVLGWSNELLCVPIALMIICWFKRSRT